MKKKDYSKEYREKVSNSGLYNFSVLINESDLFIKADKMLATQAYKSTNRYREQIKGYISLFPKFKTMFSPFPYEDGQSEIIRSMVNASQICNVGPMAAVAGAIAEYVGYDLLSKCNEVIIENGGDIFLKVDEPRTVQTFAGSSSFSNKVFFEIDPSKTPLGICTSSGTVGHSLSFGKADAVTVITKSAILADAAATAICNIVKRKEDIEKGLSKARAIEGIIGVVILMEDEVGIFGKLKLKKEKKEGILTLKID